MKKQIIFFTLFLFGTTVMLKAQCTADISTIKNVTCYGGNDGSAVVNVTGGIAPYTYLWSDGQSDSTAIDLSAGLYKVTVTDAVACIATDSVKITEHQAIVISAPAITNISCNGVCDGAINVTATGGMETLEYSKDGKTFYNSGFFNNLCPVNYTITVRDAIGCTNTLQCKIEPTITISVSRTDETCSQCNGSACINPSGGKPPYSYKWDSKIGNQTTQQVTNLCNGYYYVTITDDNNCSRIISMNIKNLPVITVSITGTPVRCYGESNGAIDLTITSGKPPFTYLWQPGGYQTEDLFNLPAANYTVTITAADGCSITNTFTVAQPSQLNVNLSSPGFICIGKCETINAAASGGNGNNTFIWNNSETTQSILACHSVPTNYSVTVTDSKACITSISKIIDTASIPVLNITHIDDQCGLCTGSVTAITTGGTQPYHYLWSNNKTTNIINGLCQGNYSVTLSDHYSCTSVKSVTVISDPPGITITSSITNATSGQNNGAIDLTITGGTPPFVYFWQPGGYTTEDLFNIPEGSYFVTVSDANACKKTNYFIVTKPSPLSVTIPAVDTICIGQYATLTADVQGGTPPYTYKWNNAMTSQNIHVCPTKSTFYRVTVTDSQASTSKAFQTVEVYPPLSISAFTPDDALCPGECTDIFTSIVGGMGKPYTLTNQDGQPIATPYHVCPTVTTTYTITAEDACTTPAVSADLTIFVVPLPLVDFLADHIEGCVPFTVQFNEISVDSGQTFLWDFSDTCGNNSSTEKNPIHKFTCPGSYDVTCTTTSVYDCKNSLTIKDMITVYPVPAADFTFTCDSLTVHFQNTSTTSYHTEWSFGDGNSSTLDNPVHTYAAKGTYIVQLYVETEHGCDSAMSHPVYLYNNSIHQADGNNFIDIYPNPAKDMINIAVENAVDNFTMEMLTIFGEVIYRKELSSKVTQIAVHDYPEGVYIIRIKADNIIIIKKVIINK